MDKIEFICTIPGLEEVSEVRPRPAKHFMPKWFKDVPSTIPLDQKAVPGALNPIGASTVKICPSFPDYFSLGYILPMWVDSRLYHNPENGEWNWSTSTENLGWDIHGNAQFVNWANPSFLGKRSAFVFKAQCPWRIITPKGWSVLQLPLFYHFNDQISVLPGVIDTDIHHEINQQVMYHGDKDNVLVNRGDPFVLYIPFKRKTKLDLEIRAQTEKDAKLFKNKDIAISTKYPPNGIYRMWQRERDKKK